MTDTDRIKRLAEWVWPSELLQRYYKTADLHWNPVILIQDAMMLVNKITTPGYSVELIITSEETCCDIYVNETVHYHSAADTASEAICQAVEQLMEDKS